MTRFALAAGLAAALLAIGGTALAARGYSDAAEDVNTAPDITAVELAETGGVITVSLTVGNFEALPPGSWVNLWFDTDSNQDTGDEGDEALVRHVTGDVTQVYRWNGAGLLEAPSDDVTSGFAGGVLTATIPRAAIGATTAFGLLVVTSRGQQVGDELLVASDFAPDVGRIAFSGSATTRVADPAGDHDAAPDITAVRVSDARTGWITFDIATPNYAVLPEASAVVLSIDADSNSRTGDSGTDLQLTLAARQVAMERWDGRRWAADELPTRARFRNRANTVSIDLHVSELRGSSRFRFSLLAADVNTAIQGVVALDVAPDDFSSWSYTLVNRPALTLSAKRISTTPSSPRAGRSFTVVLPVTRSDTGRAISSGTVECSIRLAGRSLSARGSVARGGGRCTIVLPANARGRSLRGMIAVRSGGARIVRSFAYVVR